MATTATPRQTETGSKQSVDAQRKIQKLRDLFADAPELGKKALENVLRELTSDVSQGEWPRVESAGRTGARLGKVSELTIIVPLAPGGAKRLRAFLQLLGGYCGRGQGRHRPRHAFRVPRQRHEDALRHRLRWRLGRLYR